MTGLRWLAGVGAMASLMLVPARGRSAPAGPTSAASRVAPDRAPSKASAGNPGCGKLRPSLAAISATQDLLIAPDGTLYFTQSDGSGRATTLGRYRPPYTRPELRWVDLGGDAAGLTFDPKRQLLYVGSRARKKLLTVTLGPSGAPPGTPGGASLGNSSIVRELVDVEATIQGLTLGPDGAVYYTDRGSGHIHRVTKNGAKTRVTKVPVADPSGLAFGPEGDLYVLTADTAKITRLKITGGREKRRTPFTEILGGREARGIAFDAKGRLYVTAGALFEITGDGKSVRSLGSSNGGPNDFGAGPLGCTDLYTAGVKGVSRFLHDTAGLAVPWHRL
jgi:streptogramin lyase